MVYNQTSQKLKTPRHPNPPEEWVRTAEAFDGIISLEQFEQAQEILDQRKRKYDPDYMLRQLDTLYKSHGVFRSTLLRSQDEAPCAGTFARHFGSLDFAFQELFTKELARARQAVHDQICQRGHEVLPYGDFLVLDQKLALSVQPAVPVPNGYSAYWPFRADGRNVIDITLGVLLSEPEDAEILGYVALPRWFVGNRTFRFCSTSTRAELFGRCDLDFLQQLL